MGMKYAYVFTGYFQQKGQPSAHSVPLSLHAVLCPVRSGSFF